ncbi:O-methyltransferase [Oceanobacillus kimchii]|uniref:O-methyltransferase n=1 Tax=Oceanobacillus kimchii TaxID=746691 RepID=UPI000346A38E|nr:O-methyltransferase [Oceanobacillus kimchii]
MDDIISHYLASLTPNSPEWAEQLEVVAEENNIPIMDKTSMHFVQVLLQIHQPKRILEVGTAIGYSALRMQENTHQATIVTIEKDEKRYFDAIENISKLDKDDCIKVIHGDALEEMSRLQGNNELFDTVFIDAAKGQYSKFLELADSMVKNGGLIITDNVLFRGYVATPEETPKRFRSMVKKLRDFNEKLMNHSYYQTSILPIGDGVAISYKQEVGN